MAGNFKLLGLLMLIAVGGAVAQFVVNYKKKKAKQNPS